MNAIRRHFLIQRALERSIRDYKKALAEAKGETATVIVAREILAELEETLAYHLENEPND